MSAVDPAIHSETLRRLVLARLLVRRKEALTRKKAIKAVVQAVAPPLQRADAERAVIAALEDCERLGYVSTKSAGATAKTTSKAKKSRATAKKGRSVAQSKSPAAREREPTLKLSPAGERAVPKLFGLAQQSRAKSWDQAQQLAALAGMGRAATVLASKGKEGLTQDELAALLIAAEHGLPDPMSAEQRPSGGKGSRAKRSPSARHSPLTAVIDQLAWRALGVDRTDPFTAESVQRYLLRGLVPETARVELDVFRRMLASKAVGAAKQDAKALTRALLTRPTKPKRTGERVRATVDAATRTWSVHNDNNMSTSQADPAVRLAAFARAVKDAARSPRVLRYDADRAFIGSVWENMRGRSPVGDMSLADFKDQLIQAHRERLLRITRADLVQAMDPEEVQRSEARYQNATFHFVALDAGGVR
jgi:hypothetical protein